MDSLSPTSAVFFLNRRRRNIRFGLLPFIAPRSRTRPGRLRENAQQPGKDDDDRASGEKSDQQSL
jgi:hypothetical protein